jgi:hypothetical protein
MSDLVLLLDGHEAVPDLEEGANEVNELVHGKRMTAEDRHATELSQSKLHSTDATGSPSLTGNRFLIDIGGNDPTGSLWIVIAIVLRHPFQSLHPLLKHGSQSLRLDASHHFANCVDCRVTPRMMETPFI